MSTVKKPALRTETAVKRAFMPETSQLSCFSVLLCSKHQNNNAPLTIRISDNESAILLLSDSRKLRFCHQLRSALNCSCQVIKPSPPIKISSVVLLSIIKLLLKLARPFGNSDMPALQKADTA